MADYYLKKKKSSPLYIDLYNCIKADILSGKMPAGFRLESKRRMAEHLGVSITSIENALAQLVVEGYIHSEPGRGYFVNPGGSMSESQGLTGVGVLEFEEKFKDLFKEPEEVKYRIDFKANQSSMSLFPYTVWTRLMRSVMSAGSTKMLKTVPFNGIYELRKAIADYLYHFRDMQVHPAQIIVGAGTEYLYSRILQLFGSDCIIAMEDPGYKKFSDISIQQGILWDYIPMDESGMRIDRLKSSRANVIHVSPANHFPTGIVMPIRRRMELLEWVSESPNRYIIEDDYDSEIRYSGKPIQTLFAMDKDHSNVIYMNTFSKSLVPSLRISYMVLPPALLERYVNTMSFFSCTVSSFEQLTLARFISQGYFERHIHRLKNHYKEKRNLVISRIEASKLSKIAKISEAAAGTHFLLRVKTKLRDREIKEAAIEHGIHLSLLSDYEHFFSMRNSGTIIINYAGIEDQQVDLAIEILEDIFKTDL